jgi:hypothetical protein
MNKKIVIDADSLLYRAAHLANGDASLKEALEDTLEEVDDSGLEALSSATGTEELTESQRIFHSMLSEVVTGATEGIESMTSPSDTTEEGDFNPTMIEGIEIVLTVKPSREVCDDLKDNFRYMVMETVQDPEVKGYKSNRKGMDVPEGLDELYDYVFNLDNTVCISEIEADDYCVYMASQGHIICALDKDVLGSIEVGYNYNRKEWVDNHKTDIKRFPYLQTLTGDSSDGLRGVYRVGTKGAEKILGSEVDEFELWKRVVQTYYEKGQTLEEAIATMRCVRMDQWTPEHGLQLWNPPKRNK